MSEPSTIAATRGRALTVARWLLVVPAAFAGWYLALVAAMLVYGLAQRLCPAELVVSGACTAPWHAPFFDALVVGGAALAATLIVLLPALVAPARRVAVARLAYAAGLAAAAWLVVGDTGGKSLVLPALVAACLAGAVTLWRIERRAANAGERTRRRRDGRPPQG